MKPTSGYRPSALKIFAFMIVSGLVSPGPSSNAYSQTRVDDYAGLRSLSCSPGALAEIVGGRFAGTFRCSAQSGLPRGAFDDGGLQFGISGDSDFWLRQNFNTENNPIQLNWFEWIENQARIDTLFRNLIADFDDLFIRTPSSSVPLNTLNWQDGFDANAGVKKFYFLESDQKVNIVHTGSSENVAMLVLEDYTHVKIGGPNRNIKFHGKHLGANCPYPLSGTQTCGRGSSSLSFDNGEGAGGLISLYQGTVNGVLVDWEADCKDADDYGIMSKGGGSSSSSRTQTVSVKGTFDNCGVAINGGAVHAHTEVTAMDPHAAGQGWLGTPYPNNNGCRENYEKNKAMVRVHNADRWTGNLILRYGWAKWFSADVDMVGSATSRLDVQYDSLGWTGPSSAVPGTRVDTDGCVMQGGKPDPWFDHHGDGSPTRFMRFTEQSGSNFALNDEVRFVATSNSKSWTTCCIDAEFNGMQEDMHTRVEQTTDSVRDIVIRGGATPNTGELLEIGDNYLVTGGEWCNIYVQASNIRGQPPTSNTIRDLTISDGCQLIVKDTPTGVTTIGGITFSGSPRAVMALDASGSYTVVVPSDRKLSAPVGSTIRNAGGSATLVCSGRTQSLPFTFDGTDDDCEGESSSDPPGSNSPPSASFSAVPDPTGSTLSVDFDASASTDSDGTIIGYSWNFGDGTPTSAGVSTSHTYSAPGVYTVILTVTDDGGLADVSSVEVQVLGSYETDSFRHGSNGYSGARDAMIRFDAPGVSYGTATDIQVDGDPDSGVLLAWDLTSIPPGSTVHSATIELDVTNRTTTGNTYHIYRSLRDWVEGEATWTSFAVGQDWQAAGAEGGSDRGTDILGLLQPLTIGTYTAALNATGVNVVQSWVDNPQANRGFVLSNYDGATDSFVFSSKESPVIGNRPLLTVIYEQSDGSPPPVVESQQIQLVEGWNLVSSYVEPADLSLEAVLAPIDSDVALVKDQDGNVYSPEFGINTIGSWRPLEAYQVNVRRDASLLIEGSSTDEGTPIPLRKGWNMIPVVITQSLPVEEGFFSIHDELLVAKDNFGRVYNPMFNINTIGNLLPGQGYTVYVDPSATLNYSIRGKR